MSVDYVKLNDEELIALAIEQGAHPEAVAVGQIYERTVMLCRDGTRFAFHSAHGYTLIRITQVPDGRKRTIRYVKVDARPLGNGRRDRQEHSIDRMSLARHYLLAERTKKGAK